MRKTTTLSKGTLEWISKNFCFHGGECLHFHRIGTPCLSKEEHPEALSFTVYRVENPLTMVDGVYWPYFINELALIEYFEYINR